jgi:hypothetical protein
VTSTHLSFVLLTNGCELDAGKISSSHRALFGDVVLATPSRPDHLTFRGNNQGFTVVSAMPGPVPNGEAESRAKNSYASIIGATLVETHSSHVLVMTRSPTGSMIDTLPEHLRLTASVASALDAVGIYDGNAGATHLSPFYIDSLKRELLPPALATGISLARESDDMASILTTGLGRLNLREFLVRAPLSELHSGVDYTLDLVEHVLNRQEDLADGATVGRTELERLPVTHRPSPVDESAEVVFIDLGHLSDA